MIATFNTQQNQQAMSLVINYLSANPEKERKLYVVGPALIISKRFIEKIHECFPLSKLTNYVDNVKLQYNNNSVYVMGIGDGIKVRGCRGDIVFIEADIIPKDTLTMVISGASEIICKLQS